MNAFRRSDLCLLFSYPDLSNHLLRLGVHLCGRHNAYVLLRHGGFFMILLLVRVLFKVVEAVCDVFFLFLACGPIFNIRYVVIVVVLVGCARFGSLQHFL